MGEPKDRMTTTDPERSLEPPDETLHEYACPLNDDGDVSASGDHSICQCESIRDGYEHEYADQMYQRMKEEPHG